MTIREYVINNFKDCKENDIKNSIEDSIAQNEEETLPGLGVLFEILYKNSTKKGQESISKKLYNLLKEN